MKRFVDLVFSIIGMILLFPLYISICLFIKLIDGGPILFKQKRVGRDAKSFMLYKFKTMVVSQLASDGIFEPGDSSRVTRLGKFLRKTKLDELPQLFNVLIGDMSFIGPRPEIEKWVAVYPERWNRILTIKPGITDNASIVFRNEESILAEAKDPEKAYIEIILPKKLDLYEDYLLNKSIWVDFVLIFKTIYYLFFKN